MQSICCSVDAKECNSIAIDTSIERMCEAKGQSEMKCIIGIPIFRMKAERSTLSTADEPMMPEKNEHRIVVHGPWPSKVRMVQIAQKLHWHRHL